MRTRTKTKTKTRTRTKTGNRSAKRIKLEHSVGGDSLEGGGEEEGQPIIEEIEKPPKENTNAADDDSADTKDYEVIIIGAGPAGIGVALALRCGFMDKSKLLILEQGPWVGTSFRQWHKFTRFISPSWPSFPYGAQDLNTIFPDASLGAGLQHPTGDEYADYLEEQASNYEMQIEFNKKVIKIHRDEEESLFFVHVEGEEKSPYTACCVVWCGGEWSYPRPINDDSLGEGGTASFDENCVVHYKDVDIDEIVKNKKSASQEDEGDDASTKKAKDRVIIVGLGEAGADTACALAEQGMLVTIVDGKDPNEKESKDPSCRLSPKSVDGLKRFQDQIEVLKGRKCVSVSSSSATKKGKNKKKNKDKDRDKKKLTEVKLADVTTNESTETLYTTSKVILCTGFDVSKNPVIHDLFHWRDDGCPEVGKKCDESTKTRNLFLAGPMLRHSIDMCGKGGHAHVHTHDDEEYDDHHDSKDGKEIKQENEKKKEKDGCESAVFCFIYKFRTRFAVVAQEIIYRVVQERYLDRNPINGNWMVSREGQMWGAAAETMKNFYESKQMYLAEVTSACASCT